MRTSETRKPTSAKVGSLEISKCLAAIDRKNITLNLLDLQVSRICRGYRVSVPVARIVAELAFGRAA